MQKNLGFTLIEIIVVLAVVAILLTLAIPSTHHRVTQIHTKESIELVKKYQIDIASYYSAFGEFPTDNLTAGLPQADKIIGNYLTRVDAVDGALHLTLGNKAHKQIIDKKISLRPVYVDGSPGSPVSWICGYDETPTGMMVSGDNQTNLEPASLPISCR